MDEKSKPKVENEKPAVSEKLSYYSLREFKINGTIGSMGQKETLSYTSLLFQIKQGKALKYTHSEIYSAVIRAIKPGNPLRDFLEIKGEHDEQGLIKILRSHFNEKDPGSVFQDLRHCVQLPGESAHDFCLRTMALREKVASLSEEEVNPFDPELLKSTFFKTIFTGLKQNNVRMELQLSLKGAIIADEDLLKEVSLASANEQERLDKIKGKVGINKLTVNPYVEDSEEIVYTKSGVNLASNKPQPKENKLLTEIFNLTAKVNELMSITSSSPTVKEEIAI